MSRFIVPLIIRGVIIETDLIEHGGRGGAASFSSPDVRRFVDMLGLVSPSTMSDLHALSFEEILSYLDALGERLAPSRNRWMRQAFELSCLTSGLGADVLRHLYENMGDLIASRTMREVAERAIGVPYLEGWVATPLENGVTANIRAFGARTIHIVAGNVPGVSAMSIGRSAITRSDAIIKTPSNDPMTAAAIARTMIEMAPDHPITRHLSVGYWKGGDAEVEQRLYRPQAIEKIVAWGGMTSIKHISKYIQPGVELIALDPKLSSTIIGAEAFSDTETMAVVAGALARDVGVMNQEGCSNARVVYVESGTGTAGVAKLNAFGDLLWEALMALPGTVSGPAVRLEDNLQSEIEALRLSGGDWYKVIGGGRDGAILVSQCDEPVDFARLLTNRVVNLVPVDDLNVPVSAVNSYTQTIGIYPERLKHALRDQLALQGAQRLVPLGRAMGMANHGIQDGIEPVRRMCKWIVDEVGEELPRATQLVVPA